MRAKVEILRKLDMYEPTTKGLNDQQKVEHAATQKIPHYIKCKGGDFFCEHFYHFPIVVDSDGSPWNEANRYLLSKLGGFSPSKHRTLESIASDLAHFRRWLQDEEIDYLKITPRPRARPTYRYASYLQGEVQISRCKASTAKRRISSMQNFYRWLTDDGVIFNHPLWIESDFKVNFNNEHGYKHSKAIKSTDLMKSFKTQKNNDDYSEYIDDGGKLRPLPKEEQIAIAEALSQIGNIEMLLSFYLALTTGARLQTVFTFRQQHFRQTLTDDTTYHRVRVGATTLVNTKYNKQIVLHIPSWLYHRVQIYLSSERYRTRINLSKHIYSNEDEQYAFLSRYGQPYYISHEDDFASLYRCPPRGNAITQFIRQQLKIKLIENGHDFEFRFHDLRASFGMNLLSEKLETFHRGSLHAANQPEFFELLMYVRTRMGHSQIRTTESYLNYRQKYNIAIHVQTEFELHLEGLLITGENGDDMD